MNRFSILLLVLILTGCGGSRQPATAPQAAANPDAAPAAPHATAAGHPAAPRAARHPAAIAARPQIPPVEFGHRPPNTKMTSENMPFFDIVRYCEISTHDKDTMWRGPVYENCIGEQQSFHDVIGDAIDKGKVKEDDVVRCAKTTRTAYDGMWYCMNQQPFN